jgi:hypothetical protein
MDTKDKELLDKLKEAGQPANFFNLKLEYNGKVIIENRPFPANNCTPESIESASLHFILVDCVRKIQEELKKSEVKKKNSTNSTESIQ